MPRKVFVAGEILTAADVNTNLMDQAVIVFDDADARTTAIPSPVEGLVTYLKDTDNLEKYTTDWVDAAPGKILQVVSATKTNTFTTTSTSFTTITGLSATITPSSTNSKILVTAQVAHSMAAANTVFGHFRLSGGNSSVYVGDSSGSRIRAVFGGIATNSLTGNLLSESVVFLDSPSTTSATTYSVECRGTGGDTVFVKRSSGDADTANVTRGASSITVMEVAG